MKKSFITMDPACGSLKALNFTLTLRVYESCLYFLAELLIALLYFTRYPTPTQKMAVANSIVETFPTLAAKMKASHISPAVSF